MIYTSYYSNWRKFPDSYELVAISLWIPKKFTGKHLPLLAPSKSLLSKFKNGEINEYQYHLTYRKELERKKNDIFEFINQTDNSILLCYEKPCNFCHRHILRDWVKERFGIEIQEL